MEGVARIFAALAATMPVVGWTRTLGVPVMAAAASAKEKAGKVKSGGKATNDGPTKDQKAALKNLKARLKDDDRLDGMKASEIDDDIAKELATEGKQMPMARIETLLEKILGEEASSEDGDTKGVSDEKAVAKDDAAKKDEVAKEAADKEEPLPAETAQSAEEAAE